MRERQSEDNPACIPVDAIFSRLPGVFPTISGDKQFAARLGSRIVAANSLAPARPHPYCLPRGGTEKRVGNFMRWNWRMVAAGLLTALLASGWAAVAYAQNAMIWQSGSFTDESAGGQLRAYLTFSVPETDNSAVYAFCMANSGVGTSRLAIAANTGNLPSGSTATLRFFGNGIDRTYQGAVSNPQGGDGGGGIAIDISNHDLLWRALAGLPVISVQSPTGAVAALPLRGSSGPVRDFNSLCISFEGGGVQAAPQQQTAQTFDPRWQTCETLGGQRSQESETPVTVTFRNLSDGFRSVMWIGFDGVPKQFANLNQGEAFTINTFLTHPWMFTDGPGNCIEIFMPQLGVDTFNITAPGRNFGAE